MSETRQPSKALPRNVLRTFLVGKTLFACSAATLLTFERQLNGWQVFLCTIGTLSGIALLLRARSMALT